MSMTIQLQNKITTQQPLQCRLRPLHSDPIYKYPYPIYQFVFDPKSQNKFDPSHVSPGNYGYFATSFGLESCHRFYLVAPVLKGIYSVYSPEDHEAMPTFRLPFQLCRRRSRRQSWASGELFLLCLQIALS